MNEIKTDTLRWSIETIDTALKEKASELTELDGKLGDGDLGITLRKAFARLSETSDALPDDVDKALKACAAGVMDVSSSSFGTLFATALLAAAKEAGSTESLAWTRLPDLLDAAVKRMMERGKAALGDKTVLDAMHFVSNAIREAESADAAKQAALVAVDRALDEFRQKPCLAGRARIFSERSIGMDDPGMMAFAVMTRAICN